MHTLAGHRDQHTELRQLIHNLRALMTAEQLQFHPNARIAHHLLCTLTHKVTAHLAAEEHQFYPNVLRHGDTKLKSMAWGFMSGEKPLRRLCRAYQHKWLNNREVNCCAEFLEESQEMLDMLSYRVDREEQVLFPKLLAAGVFNESSSVTDSAAVTASH